MSEEFEATQPQVAPGYAQGTTVAPPPQPGFAGPAGPAPRRGLRVGLVVAAAAGAMLVAALLVGAGFAAGRLTAPRDPSSLVDAVRMAQQGTLPCGSARTPDDRVAALVGRLCRSGLGGPGGPGRLSGPGGPGAPGGPGSGRTT